MNDSEAFCPDRIADADVVRIVCIVFMGTFISLSGMTLNSFLLISFSRLKFLNSNLLYLFLLAIFDIVVELCFVMIFVTSLFMDYFEVYPLYVVWHYYIRYISTIGQVLILSSTLLIVAASLERYLCSLYTEFTFSTKLRFTVVAVIFVAALILKGCVFFELTLEYLPHCSEFTNYVLEPSGLTRSELYRSLWMFWGRNVFTVISPFALLLFLNAATINNLNRTTKDIDAILVEVAEVSLSKQVPSLLTAKHEASSARRRKRDATRTLAALVSIYLVTNSLNLILTIMEFFDQARLLALNDGWTYKYLADLSSLLTIFSTSSRLPVYYVCNMEIRAQIRETFKACNRVTSEEV